MGSIGLPTIILIVVLGGVLLVVRYGLNAAANKANDAISNKWSRYKNAKEPQGRELLADRYHGVANLGIELPPPGTPAPLPGTRGRAQAARARQVLVDPAQAAQKAVPQAPRAPRAPRATAQAAPAPAAPPVAPAAPKPAAPKRSFCPKCGKELPPGAKFCGACGATVRERAPRSA